MKILKFEELGKAYQNVFIDKALYLIENGYIEGDHIEIAKKMYINLMKEHFKKHGKDCTDF